MYCRMFQWEDSVILSTYFKLSFAIKTCLSLCLRGRLRQVLLNYIIYHFNFEIVNFNSLMEVFLASHPMMCIFHSFANFKGVCFDVSDFNNRKPMFDC